MPVLTNYMNILPEELHQIIYMKVFNSCLDEMISLHNIREQHQLENIGCVCNMGKWCDTCFGEYDMFD